MHSMLSLPTVRQPKRLLRKGIGAHPTPIVSLLLLVILAASLILTACSSSTSQPDTFTVIDLLGRSVQVPSQPTCIVTTHPTATETLYRAGGVAAGRDTASKYPTEVLDLPTVGGSYSISTEAVAALDPDLVLIEALTQASLVDPFEQLGIPVVAVRAASLEDIVDSLTLVGEIVDNEDAAAQAITYIQNRIDAAKESAPEGKSVLIFIADADRKIYAAKAQSYPGLVAALIGLNNLAADLQGPAPYPGFALFSAEQALTSNPDVVLTITPAPPPAPRLSAVLSQMPGFKEMPAVKAGQVVELDPVLFLQAQGPRIADAVEGMLNIVKSP
jgi:ABC-type Fe3+-hydroxamate transport system substrate-binding protein